MKQNDHWTIAFGFTMGAAAATILLLLVNWIEPGPVMAAVIAGIAAGTLTVGGGIIIARMQIAAAEREARRRERKRAAERANEFPAHLGAIIASINMVMLVDDSAQASDARAPTIIMLNKRLIGEIDTFLRWERAPGELGFDIQTKWARCARQLSHLKEQIAARGTQFALKQLDVHEQRLTRLNYFVAKEHTDTLAQPLLDIIAKGNQD